MLRPGSDRSFLIVVRLRGSGSVEADALTENEWKVVVDTEDPRFAMDPAGPSIDYSAGSVHFSRPGAVVLQSTTG
jgi:hypothetical protein